LEKRNEFWWIRNRESLNYRFYSGKKTGFITGWIIIPTGKSCGIIQRFIESGVNNIMENKEPIDNTLMICGSGVLLSIFDKMSFTGGTGDMNFHSSQDIVPKRRIITTFGESMKDFPEGRTPNRSFRIIEWLSLSRLKASTLREPGLLSYLWCHYNMWLYNMWLYIWSRGLYRMRLYTYTNTTLYGMSDKMS